MTSSPDIRGAARNTRTALPYEHSTNPETTNEVAPAPVDEVGPEITDATAPVASPPAASKPSQAGFFPLLLGGVVAGAIGFAVARFALPPQTDPELPARITGVEQSVVDLSGRLDDIDGAIADVAAQIPEPDTETPEAVASLGQQLSSVGSEVATLRTTVDSLSDTVTNLTIGGGEGETAPDFAAAFDSQMEQFQAEVDRVTANAQSEAEAARAEAAATRAAAEAEAAAALEAAATAELQADLRAGLAEVQIALDTGAPFAGALQKLDGIEIPAALSEVAEDGVRPLTDLQQSFPEAARLALQAADRSPDDTASPLGRVTAFLKTQTNARSLQPRDGDEADAVLSRAEAALKSGDLGAALGEIGSLSDGPMDAISGWLEEANARDAALKAVVELNSTVDAM